MASLKQTIANRLNALKSTGPRTAEGKARAARNALKHGLSRLGSMPPADLADRIADRKDCWRSAYSPEGPAQEWVFERLCAESVRLDACERRILAARAELAERASESWDDDRAAEVAELASRLGSRPEVIQPKLLQSRHGVLWLLERWDEVADSLGRCDGWTPETWDRAMDCLGVSAAARLGSGPWDLDPEDRGAGPGLELVRRAVEGLRLRLESHLDDRDERARSDAEEGLGVESPEVRRLERYAADARRRVSWCTDELRRLQGAASSAAERPADRPVPARPPRPDRPPSASQNVPDEGDSPEPRESQAGPISVDSPMPSPPSGLSFSGAIRDRREAPTLLANRRARRAQAACARRN